MRKKTLSVIFFLLLLPLIFVSLSCSGKKESPTTSKPEEKPISTSSFPMGGGRTKPAQVKPTYLSKGENFKSYVDKYYHLVKDGKYTEAYEMAPTERRARDTLENFTASLRSMPIQSYEVGEPLVKGEQAEVKAVMQLGGMAQGSKWIVTWFFVKDKKKGLWEARKTQSQPVQ